MSGLTRTLWPTLRRSTSLAAICASALFGGALIFSFICTVIWCWRPLHGVTLGSGVLILAKAQPPPHFWNADSEFWVPHVAIYTNDWRHWSGAWRTVLWLQRVDGLNTSSMSIPLWMPLVLCAVVALMFSHWPPLIRKGRCRRCHYDLTGNVSGMCPECGTVVRSAPTGLRFRPIDL